MMDIKKVTAIATAMCDERPGWGTPVFIASGNSGGVFRVVVPSYGAIALKIYDPAFFTGENAPIEARRIDLQQGLRGHGHPHLIDIFDAEEIKEHGTWYLVMELCDWPSLDSVIAKVPDEKVPDLIGQLAECVNFLESSNFIHRDIKPANIAISPDFSLLKLLDLGVMRHMNLNEGNGTDTNITKRNFIATTQYSPPEYLSREEAPGEEGFKALNVYQVGAVLHDLIMKKPLFDAEAKTQNRHILSKAIENSRPNVYNRNVPTSLIAICQASLEKNPKKRIASVSLNDMIRRDTDADAMRKRLAARLSNSIENSLSLDIWRRSVANWLRDAAIQEKDSLRPLEIKENVSSQNVQWTLTFPEHQINVFSTLSTNGNKTELHLTLGSSESKTNSQNIIMINNKGPSLSKEDVVDLIAEKVLYIIESSSLPCES